MSQVNLAHDSEGHSRGNGHFRRDRGAIQVSTTPYKSERESTYNTLHTAYSIFVTNYTTKLYMLLDFNLVTNE